MCGRCSSTARIADQPSPASKTSPIQSRDARWPRSALRASGSSSAMTTTALRVIGVLALLARETDPDFVARRAAGLDLERRRAAVDRRETLLQRAQTVAGPAVGMPRRPGPVVPHTDD